MERLRDHMEAAIRERWQERPLAERPAERNVPAEGTAPLERTAPPETAPAAREPARLTVAPRDARASAVRTVPVSQETFARNRIVAAQVDDPSGNAYRDLQHSVLQRIDQEGLRVIGVTSPTAGSGKTLTAVNLAMSLAVSAHRSTMILDLDLRAPDVHKLFGVDLSAALEDHLFKGVALNDVLFSPSIAGLTILPAQGGARAAHEVIRSRRIATLLETIKQDYPEDILIVDLPSLSSADDGQVFASLVDRILLVVEDDVTEEQDYRRALDSFSGPKLLGTVLNRVPLYRDEF